MANGHDLSNRTAIVTGGAGGLGTETARALASAGAQVVLAVRDAAAGGRVAQQLRAEWGVAASAEVLDLASFASIRTFAERWGNRPLHLLINNAGVMGGPLAYTADGLEKHIGVNHFGHFLLTTLLVPALERAGPSRVVQLTSGGHRPWPVDFDDMHFRTQAYALFAAYGRSKAANVMFAVGFQKRFGPRGITANAVMPGVIRTELMRDLSTEESTFLFSRVAGLPMKTPQQGAATSVWAAVADELEGVGGLCLEDCAVAKPAQDDSSSGSVAAHVLDPERADRLWSVSERTTGIA
ncbi:SDR family NAD(P)-dependent oxidoreductase [Variovorax sp. WS11]|uniref:SDR family NAD(P)-dependent oxidoreductase n=1 Tax=Variovorax sp. WS11 TaxID=1105204 RepID=UPI0031BB90B0